MGQAKGSRWLKLLGLEEGNNRQDAAMIFLGFRQVQLRKDASDVLLDRSLGDPQPLADPRIGAPLRHEREHVTLPLRERGQWVSAPANRDELLHERGVDD
jgi:hypothetical protein